MLLLQALLSGRIFLRYTLTMSKGLYWVAKMGIDPMKRSNLVIYEKDIAKVKESVNFSNISFL